VSVSLLYLPDYAGDTITVGIAAILAINDHAVSSSIVFQKGNLVY